MEKKIMLVDDAAFMRMTIKNVLTKMGYTNLLEAADGAQAVEMGQEAMVVQAIKEGAMDFIVKPFKPDRILQTVTKILG